MNPRVLNHLSVARPKPHPTHFVRIGVLHEPLRPRPLRRQPPRKSRNRQIETAPEKMYRTALPDKSRTKFPKNIVHADKTPPKPLRILGIVRRMAFIQSEPPRPRPF